MDCAVMRDIAFSHGEVIREFMSLEPQANAVKRQVEHSLDFTFEMGDSVRGRNRQCDLISRGDGPDSDMNQIKCQFHAHEIQPRGQVLHSGRSSLRCMVGDEGATLTSTASWFESPFLMLLLCPLNHF